MKMKESLDIFTLKLNPIKESLIKQKKEKEKEPMKYQKKKQEQKIVKDSIGIYPLKGLNFIKNEIRNTTAPNKNRSQIKKNFQHLKITAKNKMYTNILNNNRMNNFNDIFRSKKILGKSLPKNSMKNNHLYNLNQDNDNQNLSSNDTKNILAHNNNI